VRVGDLDGDGFAEGDFDKDGDVDAADIRAMTEAQAAAIYKSQWWDRYRYGDIHDQAVATKVFDLSVNMGPVRAHSLLQQALRSADKPVPVDGEMGPKTIAAVNAAEPRILLAALRSEAGGFYRKLDKRAFLAGWLRRAYS
jgi:lysozyme family protein